MPRASNLALTQMQEQKLIAYLGSKRESLEQDNAERIKIDASAWCNYWLDVRNRASTDGTIYPLSNIPIPVFAMIAEHFVSRIEDSTSGEQPYWHFEAVGKREQEARDYTNYFGWKLDQGGVHTAMLDSQLPTVIQSASVQKATYTKEQISWIDREARVLHDKRTNEPVETITHGPVIENEDQWDARPDPVGAFGQIANGIGGLMGMQPVQPKMRQHLVNDPTVIFDDQVHEWRSPPGGLKRTQVVFSGAQSQHIRYDRIFCAMEAESFERSDVMELQDRTLDWFRANWLERPWATWTQYEPSLKTGDTTQKTNTSATGLGRTPNSVDPKIENRTYDTVNPVRRIAEFWVERDVLGDGTLPPQRFVCWYDIDLMILVNYEWQAKVCPDLRRPYTVTALSKPPNRWCGMSIWQRGRGLFEGVDRLFNGEFYRTLQQANPPKGGDPTAAEEEPDEIAHDPTKYWRLKPSRTIDDLLSYAKVPDTNQRTQQVMEFIIFWIQLWLGVSNIAQGDYAAVPANSTATGISKTLQEASLLGRRWIRRKLDADQEHLTKLVKIIIATIDQNAEEIYEFTDGDRRMAATIMGAEVRTLNIHVEVIEQQHFKEQDIARCKAAIEAIGSFFAQLNPAVRQVMLPFYVEILQDLGFKSAAEQLQSTNEVPMTSEMGGQLVMGPNGKPQLPSAQEASGEKDEPEVKASMSIQTKWDQLTSDERGQIMGKIGVIEHPASVPKVVAPSPNPADKPAPKAGGSTK